VAAVIPGAFDDEEIVHVEGEVEPPRDLDIIHDEIRLKDLEYLKKHLEPMERSVGRGGGDKKKKEEYVRKWILDY
jgi:obg-like ATPase 1